MIKLTVVKANVVRFKGVNYLPEDVIEVEGLADGFKRLIAEGVLEVLEDRKATKEVAKEVEAKKRVKKEPKTIDEAETGGEYK